MLFSRKKNIEQHAKSPVNSFIDAGFTFNGDMRFNGTAQFNGKQTGSVTGEGEGSTYMVGSGALVEGSIEADHIVIDGEVRGPVNGKKTVLVRAKGRVFGDISYGRIQIEDGAVIEGTMVRNKIDDSEIGETPILSEMVQAPTA